MRDDNKPKIGMLLDIENVFAESSNGLGQLILCICLILIPPLIIAYTALYMYVPIWILLLVCAVWAIRVIMKVPGREKERFFNYKQQRNDVYSNTADMVSIKTIHKQGCIEYTNGEVGFFVVTYNTTTTDVLLKSKQFNRFFKSLVGDHAFDFYIQNLTDTEQLENRYADIKMYSDQESAKAFMEIIDYNKQYVSRNSSLTKNIIFVRDSKYMWKEMLNDCKTALRSDSAKIFKIAYLVTDRDEIERILSRDVHTNVNINNMIKKKYCTGERYGSKIISYDYADKREGEKKVVHNVDSNFIPNANK